MTAVMKLQRHQIQPAQMSMPFGGRGRAYGQMDHYGGIMGGPMGMGGMPGEGMGYGGGGRGGARMANMGRG